MSFLSFINTCLNFLPVSCLLCGLSTRQAHHLCTPCFASCRVYADVQPLAQPAIFSVFPYEDPVMRMIRKLKFNHQLTYAKALAHLIATEVQERWYLGRSLPDCLIVVPLHADRLRERGFNQALEIARYVARELGIALDYRSVVRIKPTLAQSGLSKTARRKNIQGAFVCTARFDGLHVAILDDVVTTGQTVSEISKVVERQGAEHIDIWCCARA